MTHTKSESNSKNQYNNTTYNYCAGKDCKNMPTHLLKLVLIKKTGLFCDSCLKYLQENNLIESVLDESVGK
jgi:hypothetical protein